MSNSSDISNPNAGNFPNFGDLAPNEFNKGLKAQAMDDQIRAIDMINQSSREDLAEEAHTVRMKPTNIEHIKNAS